jgi:hypothetical protein
MTFAVEPPGTSRQDPARPPGSSRRAAWTLGLGLTAAWLVVAALLLGDYGPTLDCVSGEYPHGEQYLAYITTGEARFMDFGETGLRPEHREPHLAYPKQIYEWQEAHPFTALLSAASCRILWTRLGWLDSLRAHNLAVVLMAALLLFVLVGHAARRFGLVAGAGTAVGLMLSPGVFAHSFNNLKDVPEACLYALAILSFAGALDAHGRRRALLFLACGAWTGFALAQKPNAYFIPVQCGLYWMLSSLVRLGRGRPAPAFPWRGVMLAAPAFLVAYLGMNPPLWGDVPTRIAEHIRFFMRLGLGARVEDQLDGLKSVVFMTPPAILLAALVGLASPRLSWDQRLLFGLGVALPVGRTMLPGARNFDGFRHFLEFQPFLALLAGVGLATLADATAALARRSRARLAGRTIRAAGAVLIVLFVVTPLSAVVQTHPNGICYFNAFVGGLGGAQAGPFEHMPTDYWANSYWQGLAWLSEHADQGATIEVPIAANVARAAAPLRLRPDLRLGLPASGPVSAPLYVMYITRKSFYDAVVEQLDAGAPALHELQVQGGTILRIHRFTDQRTVDDLARRWRDVEALARARRRLARFVAGQPPDVAARLVDALTVADQRALGEAYSRARDLLPDDLHADALLVLRDGARTAPH